VKCLEQRTVMSANFTGTLSGPAFLDANHDGKVDSGDLTMAGVPITLSGTTAGGSSVNVVANTSSSGHCSFISG
jgi:hypothetical protein